MKTGDDPKELLKAIGNPKIIFVLGGPASGKGTQCEKMVEEFGYTHISTGDLMRAEQAKGTKEGERIKKIMADGGLVPFELTVQILINALIATPSQNYLIDGFPRAVDQAQYFEQNCIETQQVLYYDVPQEIMLERCMKRAETSGRSDDNAETIKKRVQNYFDQTYPVIEYYKKFGKVRTIDATGDISEVYAQTKEAILPQTMMVLGPKASGKSKIAENLAERTNMAHINFDDFVEENELAQEDDETVTMALIKKLSTEIKPRVILENFPQNTFQAKFFIRNCKQPSNVFSLECSKDVCQERMIALGERSPQYVSSAILSQKIKAYYQTAKDLIPYLQSNTAFVSVNTDRSFEKTMEDINRHIEPCVIHIRPGANSNILRKEITEKLSSQHGFIDLDINGLIRDENERKTAIGIEMHQMVQSNRIIPAEMIVRMLKKIIYSGQPNINKFILTSFPDIIEQAKEFELNCSKISAIIYATTDDSIVEIKNNNLSLFNIDSLFQKEFRLKTMSEWDFSIFNEKLGNKTEFGVVVGRSLSGKTTLSQYMANNLGYTVIDMKSISEKVKSKLGTEDEPFEGEVPIANVEKEIEGMITSAKAAQPLCKFIFDGFTHKEPAQFTKFVEKFGLPSFVLSLTAGQKAIKERFCKKNEVDDVPEEAAEELKQQEADGNAIKTAIEDCYKVYIGRVSMLKLATDASLETTFGELTGKFSPQVILVNHEKRLGIDTTCANLAIKYNMIYISAYQIIKQHIEGNSEWGKKLLATKREKEILLTTQVRDEFNEAEYSPVHFEQQVVMDLLKETIASKRSNQGYVLLEGLCNNPKLSKEEDQLELRLMDEFIDIEKNIGGIKAIIGLQFAYEPEIVEETNIEWEKFPEPEPVAKPQAPAEGEEPPEGEEVKKVPAFKPEQYQWTITNRQSKNLPQIFLGMKGRTTAVHEVKTAEQFSSSQYEAISRSLDEFCQKVVNEPHAVYQQIIFTE